MVKNIARAVHDYIEAKPFVRENLKKGLLNYSALARAIISELKLEDNNFDAVLVAIRRCSASIKPKKEFESKIVQLIKNGRIEVKNKVCSIVLDSKIPASALATLINEISAKGESVQIIQGNTCFTVITSEFFGEKIEKTFQGRILNRKYGLVQITLKTDKEVEYTPGFVAYVYGLFSQHGINIIETMSSWTETLFVIEEKDLQAAMQALKV